MCDILDELFSKCEMLSGFDCQVEETMPELIHAVDGGVGTHTYIGSAADSAHTTRVSRVAVVR